MRGEAEATGSSPERLPLHLLDRPKNQTGNRLPHFLELF